ncbi:MAG: ABC transporter permease [Firmicutes bacterium]|nr:ABC transporter permease [Bacillota bacterium]
MKQKQKKEKATKQRTSFRPNNKVWFAAPFVIFLMLMVVIPLGLLFYYAFASDGGASANFGHVFGTTGYMRMIGISLGIALFAATIAVLIAYPIAYGLSMVGFKRVPTILLLFIAPMWINLLLRSFALDQFYELIGLGRGFWALIIALVIDYLPLAILPMYVALSGINKKFIEASYDLGATRGQMFRKTVLPLSVPGIITGFLLVFTPVMSTYFLSMYFGTNETRMIGEMLNVYVENHILGIASVIAMVILVIILFAFIVANRLSKIGNKRGGVW